MTRTTTPGLDLDRLRSWLDHAAPGRLQGEIRAKLFVGGRSNLTYLLESPDDEMVLRRPPVGHLLATAHDMTREQLLIRALHPTCVPVPFIIANCETTEVLGAPFYLMDRVDGVAHRHAAELEAWGPTMTRAVSEELVDVLAALHSIDPAEVGLEYFARPGSYVERQLDRWRKQFAASQVRHLPDVVRLHRALVRRMPTDSGSSVVHGDFRLDNALVSAEGKILAVVDWELAAIGDPAADLALFLMYQRLGEMHGGRTIADASSAPGFLDHDSIVDRYAERVSFPSFDLGFHLGLAAFKIAGILEGIYARRLQGQTAGAESDGVEALVEPLLSEGLESLARAT